MVTLGPRAILGIILGLAVAAATWWVTSLVSERDALRGEVAELNRRILVQQRMIDDRDRAIDALEAEAADSRAADERADKIKKEIDSAPGGQPVPDVIGDALRGLREAAP